MKLTDIEKNPYVKVDGRDWIGQGWGFKADSWENSELDDVIYIPEYGYEFDDEEHKWKIECPYTKQDFIDVCDGNKSDAEDLFYGVDWQFPETLRDEGYLEEK